MDALKRLYNKYILGELVLVLELFANNNQIHILLFQAYPVLQKLDFEPL